MYEYIDNYMGVQFCVLFASSGYRFGCVQIPDISKEEIDNISCHNGIRRISSVGDRLFNNTIEIKPDEDATVLAVYPDRKWIIFKCDGPEDLIDYGTLSRMNHSDKYKKQPDDKAPFATVKDTQYCIEECKHVINQIILR